MFQMMICDYSGKLVGNKKIPVADANIAMSKTHIVVVGEDVAYIWFYR